MPVETSSECCKCSYVLVSVLRAACYTWFSLTTEVIQNYLYRVPFGRRQEKCGTYIGPLESINMFRSLVVGPLVLVVFALALFNSPIEAQIMRDRSCNQGGNSNTMSMSCQVGSVTAGAGAMWMVSDMPGAVLTARLDGQPVVAARTFPWNGGGLRIQIFAVANLGAGSHRFTASWSSPVSYPTMTVDIFNGTSLTSMVDGSVTLSNSLTCSPVTRTGANEVEWAAGVIAAGIPVTAGPGYSGVAGYSSNVETESASVPSIGQGTPTFGGSFGSHPTVCLAAALRPYGAIAGTTSAATATTATAATNTTGAIVPRFSTAPLTFVTLTPPTAAAVAPTFTPGAGSYGAAQTVVIATTSAAAKLYYTTDGSTPTTSSTMYSGPVTVAINETLKAVAIASRLLSSAVSSADYTVGGNRTWYARAGGGDRSQCTGLSTAVYPGSGSGMNCAYGDVRYFYEDGHGTRGWVGAGGDTYDVGNTYPSGATGWPIGWNNPNTARDGSNVWGVAGDNQHSFIPSFLPGTPEHPTTLRGSDYESCNTKAQLFGRYGLRWTVTVDQPYVTLDCLEITTHNGVCQVSIGGGTPCNKEAPAVSDFAYDGIETNNNAHDILLKNVDIHGFDNSGIRGPIGLNFSYEHLRIAFNGMTGWNFDPGGTVPAVLGSASGQYLMIEGNGCYEKYPVSGAFPARQCYSQQEGGNGDAVGTPDNFLLSFACDHCTFRYNTQDGLDLLHTKGGTNTITNSASYGNAGQQWKFGPQHSITFTNNYTKHNCNRLSVDMPGANAGSHLTNDLCRAAGDMFAFAIQGDADDPNAKYVIENNTFITYGATVFDVSYCASQPCSTGKIYLQNNIVYGYANPFFSHEYPGLFNFGPNLNGCTDPNQDGHCSSIVIPAGIFVAKSNNLYFHMKACPSDEPGCSTTTDPRMENTPAYISEPALDAVNPNLTPASVLALAHGVSSLLTPLMDFSGLLRPVLISIGAFELGDSNAVNAVP